jgi:hypothetical protein
MSNQNHAAHTGIVGVVLALIAFALGFASAGCSEHKRPDDRAAAHAREAEAAAIRERAVADVQRDASEGQFKFIQIHHEPLGLMGATGPRMPLSPPPGPPETPVLAKQFGTTVQQAEMAPGEGGCLVSAQGMEARRVQHTYAKAYNTELARYIQANHIAPPKPPTTQPTTRPTTTPQLNRL